MFFWPARQKRAASRNRVRVIVIVDLPPQSVQARGVGYTDVSSDIQAPNNACHCLGTSADLEEVRSRRLCADKAKRYLCFRAARAVSWAALGVVLVVEEPPPPPVRGSPQSQDSEARLLLFHAAEEKGETGSQ